MKKRAIVFLAFAAALTAVSCQKEAMKEAEITPTGEGMTISAVSEGIGAETKAAMVYKYDVVWKTGDKICVKNSEKSVEFTLSGGEETTKGTFSSGESISGDVEGFYPSSIVTDGGLVWPAEQGSKQICPMYCKKTLSSTQNQTFNFASLGSVLQLNFNSTTAGIVLKSIEVKADEAMSGAFTINEEGKAVISQPEGDKPGITLDLGEGLALGTSAKKFNIAVPAGEYHGLSIVLRATNGKKCTINAKKDKAIKIVYNTVNTLAISGEFKLDLPAGALPGVFTVSNDDGVTKRPIFFSKGNLYCSGVEFYTDEAADKYGTVKSMANAQWGFEANQYDTTPSSNGSRVENHISHFMWCADATNAMALKYDDGWQTDTTFFAGKNFTVNGYSGWHTLSTKEWQYLFAWNSTLNSGWGGFDENLPRYGKINYGVTVCGKANCVVLLPDNWEWDESTVGTDWQKNTSDIIEYSEETTIKWSTMQAAGAVCLPAAGSRDGSPHSQNPAEEVRNVGDYGYYWSSTANTTITAYDVGFGSQIVHPDGSIIRNGGISVRLVTESK